MAHPGIRFRFVTILLVGGVSSLLSILALIRALGLAEAQRVERAREAVVAELQPLAAAEPSPAALAGPPATTFIGMRGGWLSRFDQIDRLANLPPAWRQPLEQTVAEAAATHARAVRESRVGSAVLVIAAQPGKHALAWAAYLIPPSSYLRPWRWLSVALLFATSLFVLLTIGYIISFRNGTVALQRTMAALPENLSTPVPTPRVADLAGIAEGVRRMAAALSSSRESSERLSRELAQKERLAALGRVAAGVAHEVRNPLASIKLRLDLTAAAHELAPAARNSVQAASQEIARLDRLVSDLLLVAGKKMGPKQPIELGALVRARVDALQPWAETRDVTVRAGGEASAEADPESVARAVDNVLRNAVEAAPAGSTVEAHVQAANGKVSIDVEDRGAGVEPAREKELFEPFFTTKSEGTGLGLAISRAIARAHGGELTYQRVGEVTRFSLELPRTEKRS